MNIGSEERAGSVLDLTRYRIEMETAALRAELCLAYDVIGEIPDEVLERMNAAKMLKLYEKMNTNARIGMVVFKHEQDCRKLLTALCNAGTILENHCLDVPETASILSEIQNLRDRFKEPEELG